MTVKIYDYRESLLESFIGKFFAQNKFSSFASNLMLISEADLTDILEKCSIYELCQIWRHTSDIDIQSNPNTIGEDVSPRDSFQVSAFVQTFEKKKAGTG